MFKYVGFFALLFSVSMAGAAPYVRIEQLYETVEVDALKITLNKRLSGKIILQNCASCEKVIVNITPNTKAFIGAKEVPLIQAKKQIGKSVLVSYVIKDKIVTRIEW